MYRIAHRQDYPSICQCVMNDHVINQQRQHLTSVPKLFSLFHILFRLYCLYLQNGSLSHNLIYFSSCNYIFVTHVTVSIHSLQNKMYLFIYLFNVCQWSSIRLNYKLEEQALQSCPELRPVFMKYVTYTLMICRIFFSFIY